jgi:pimeloyl-ACP methyl ester carboxylesterase
MGDATEWLAATLARAGEPRGVEVDGADIHYLRWGDASDPGLVLVHGGAAHARWWDHLAPLFSADHHVVALDLSGHGDSGRRDRYDAETWAREVVAVAADAGMAHAPVVVGHSLGGFVSIVVAARHGHDLAGAVIVDSPVRRPDPEVQEAGGGRMFRAPKVYPSLEEGMAHFHLVPPQPVVRPDVVEHVARHSLREREDGWTWKFDPRLFEHFSTRAFGHYLPDAKCRMAVFHGELSHIVDRDITTYMSELLGHHAPFVEIPQAYHHLILDQPLAFAAALRAILADWQHTVPAAGPASGRGPTVVPRPAG